jgi:flagellar motility protein MotE (MotC chaperone)
MKKEKKGLNPHIRNLFLTIVLLIVFFLTVIGSVVFFDILGIINFSKIVPRESALARVPYIGKYVEYSYYQHLDEEERIKETMNKYRNILEERGKQLDLKEQDIVLREKELETLQVKLKDMEKVLIEKETKLKTYEEQVNKISSDYNASENNVERFASIYTSMTPEAVAKIALKSNLSTIARIFEKMDNKKIALILDVMAKENPQRVMDLVDLMTKKGKAANE